MLHGGVGVRDKVAFIAEVFACKPHIQIIAADFGVVRNESVVNGGGGHLDPGVVVAKSPGT